MTDENAQPAPDSSTNLIWIDLEMTGLDTGSDHIIEIATIVTDNQLNELAEGPVIAIRQSRETTDAMDEWNRRHHGDSGLTARVLASTTSTQEAESATLAFLRTQVAEGASPMCGNSICQDRRFLAREMPALESFFHYRNLDVSTLKILAQRWAPGVASGFNKESAHRAQADIRDSIAELAYYRVALLNQDVINRDA
jgi:oligoribonuclease